MTSSDRFWSKVDRREGECWLWTAGLNQHGYGWFHNSESQLAHRHAYELLRGPIPDGLVIDHLCRNRACVNPDHMEPVTRGENVRRGAKGRLVTHCVNGHVYDEANTYTRGNGTRSCRTCRRAQKRRFDERRRAAQLLAA
jgi:hypothetical protein